MAQKNSSPKKPATQLKKLNFLIGEWHTSGKVSKASSGSSKIIRGMDTYEWISGGFFILHRVDVFMGNKKTEAVEIIGYDEIRKCYFMKSFDSEGASTTMYAELEKPRMLKFGDNQMRSVLTAQKDGHSMSAKWELSKNGKAWKSWMKLEFEK
ncbi:MAG: DUF1579 family protein [Bacteroidota bacterium]